MSGPNQSWTRGAESGAGDAKGHPVTRGDSQPYADTDRFGKTQTGDTAPIMTPRNLVSDEPWGVNAPAGGTITNTVPNPEIPITKGM